MQYFGRDLACFSSLVINLRDGDELEAEKVLKYF
jgi:hypothetical protein